MHENDPRLQALEDRITALEQKLEALENPSLSVNTKRGLNYFEFGNHSAGNGGYVWVDKDEHDLPTLRIEVDEGSYSGVISHKELFRLIGRLIPGAADG